MSVETQTIATIEDLYRIEGKAELIGGRIVHLMTGFDANIVAGEIYSSLRAYVRQTQRGHALTDGMGFTVTELSSGRQSFSPDASYYCGPRPEIGLRFVHDAPTFAVEVRSENDYGKTAEAAIAAKRADYFEAGTLAVWDVDTVAEEVRCYRADAPNQPTTFHRGDVADAEPAVPGWRMPVDEVFG